MSKKTKLTSYTLGHYLMKSEYRDNKFCEVYTGSDTRYDENPPVEIKVVDMEQGFNTKMLEYESRVRKELLKNGLFRFNSRLPLQVSRDEHPG